LNHAAPDAEHIFGAHYVELRELASAVLAPTDGCYRLRQPESIMPAEFISAGGQSLQP